MAKKNVHKVGPLTEGKKNIIASLLEAYDIESVEDIQEALKDLLGGFVSDVTDKILGEIDDWHKRPLDDVYPIVFVDAVHFSVRSDNVIRKLAAYVILGINKDGCKEVISLQIGENESSKYWLGVFNELKNRGVKDIMVLCADGISTLHSTSSEKYFEVCC